MATRTLAQVAPTAGEIALNAYIHGYGGHSLVTPHAALKQLWWTDERIQAKVTKAFVISKLRGEEREFLKRELQFGAGLTDDTYLDWILDKAKRLFLILTEIGAPDQIFGCIDDSWTDDDLPVKLRDIPRLDLSYENDDALNQRFYKTQFTFLLRHLGQGGHIEYGPQEHIPLDYVNTLPPAVTLQPWDRVHMPGDPETVFVRRKFPLTDKETSQDLHGIFIDDVQEAQRMTHHHVATAWASYVSENYGYVLSDFVGEHTLRSFMDHRTPMQFMRVGQDRRPILLCEWLHCLADAVAYMHNYGKIHGAIRPSNILIDHDNNIAFAEVGGIRTFQQKKRTSKTEAYDYSAPESQVSREHNMLYLRSPPQSSRTLSGRTAFSRLRKLSISTGSSNSSTEDITPNSSVRTSLSTINTSPMSSIKSPGRESSAASFVSHAPSWLQDVSQSGSPAVQHFSRPPERPLRASIPMSLMSTLPDEYTHPTVLDPNALKELPTAEPEMSDIYSLGCVYLDILTFMLKGKLTDFVKFRTTKSTRRGKIRADTSFHADLEALDAWMDLLELESGKYAGLIYRGVPELLALIRTMLVQNASLRPTAKQVRDGVHDILHGKCKVEHLCCDEREWQYIEPEAVVPSRFRNSVMPEISEFV